MLPPAQQYNNLDFKPDAILTSDMLNLPLFKSIAKTDKTLSLCIFMRIKSPTHGLQMIETLHMGGITTMDSLIIHQH